MDTRDAKRIVLTNQLTLSYIVIALPYLILFKLIGTDALAWMLIAVILLDCFTFWLNAKGHFLSARLNLALVTSSAITAYAFALGRGSNIHLLLLPATMNFLILFDWEKERAYAAVGLAANAILFVGYQSLSFHAGTWYTLPHEVERTVRIAMAIAAELVILAGTLHFLVVNRKTERALAGARENALAGEKIKSRFIANMSHEIRTPLNVIIGMVHFLDRPQPEDKRKELVNHIRGAADDLLAIVNDVLDLSKIEAGKLKLESIPFKLRKHADDVLQSFLPEASQKGLQLSLEMEAGMPDSLRGDPLRLRQILNNLLSNALKFTKSGRVILRIYRAKGSGESQVFTFELQDSGIGIPEEAQSRLFHFFGQADDSTTRNFGGTGLGLAICKHLAELMGGCIRLSSRPGIGTTVHFTLPFDLATEADAPEFQGSGDWIGGPNTGVEAEYSRAAAVATDLKILIVEDQMLNRMVLKDMLGAIGFKAEEAFDGNQALEACSARPFDLILMDCHMPLMDGFECTKRIRKRGGLQPLIVGVTADAMAETRARCLQAGMNEVILKPLEEGALRKILAPWKSLLPEVAPSEKPVMPASEWVDIPRLTKLVKATKLRDPMFRRKALGQFDSDARELSRALHDAFRSGDTKALHDSAHGLKGLCLTMGLNKLADICKSLESTAAKGTGLDWSPAIAELEVAFEPSLAELQRVADPSGPG